MSPYRNREYWEYCHSPAQRTWAPRRLEGLLDGGWSLSGASCSDWALVRYRPGMSWWGSSGHHIHSLPPTEKGIKYCHWLFWNVTASVKYTLSFKVLLCCFLPKKQAKHGTQWGYNLWPSSLFIEKPFFVYSFYWMYQSVLTRRNVINIHMIKIFNINPNQLWQDSQLLGFNLCFSSCGNLYKK